MKSRNTLQRGSTRYLVFKDGDTYFGTALELNIVVEGDSPAETFFLLLDAIGGYIEAARKIKIRDSVLNQSADPEYEAMWNYYLGRKLQEKWEGIINKMSIFHGGKMQLVA
jgi:hypothetical protein